jgi:hypothetical protein
MACRRVTPEEFKFLPQGTKGFDSADGCTCEYIYSSCADVCGECGVLTEDRYAWQGGFYGYYSVGNFGGGECGICNLGGCSGEGCSAQQFHIKGNPDPQTCNCCA